MTSENAAKRQPRRRALSPKDVSNLATEMMAMAEKLLSTKTLMDFKGLKSVEFDGVGKFRRGLDLVNEFDADLTAAVQKAKPPVKAAPKK